jgi:hypothetical protein
VSEDWKVGDLALCVDASPTMNGRETGLAEGRVYRVTAYFPIPEPSKFGPSPGILVGGVKFAGRRSFSSARFRKIRPDEHEDCEPEFVELLKRSKKRVSA